MGALELLVGLLAVFSLGQGPSEGLLAGAGQENVCLGGIPVKKLVIALLAGLLPLLSVAGCGATTKEEPTTTVAAPSTTSATKDAAATLPSTVSSTTGLPAGTELDEYARAVKGWHDEYSAKIEEGTAFLDTLESPLEATDEDVEAAKGLADLMKDCASAFEDIQPPPEAAAPHEDYLKALESLATGAEQFYKALENKSASDLFDALATLTMASENRDEASTALESILGFSLKSGGKATTAAGLGTRENPIPVGQEARVGDWVVKVVGFTPDAWPLIQKENEFNDPPEENQQYVLIKLEATYAGEESGTFWVDMSYHFLGSKGNTFDTASVVAPDEISDTGEAFAGAHISGNLVFAVDSDQIAGGLLMLEPSFSFDEERVFFAIE